MSIDTLIVIGFLVITLAIGLIHGKKVKTIQDYALGNRKFSTAALVSTIVATWASGSGFFVDLNKTYSKGLEFIIPLLGVFLSLSLVLFIFIPKMESFIGKNSVAEAMGELYGKKVQTFIAISGIISSAGSVAVQFNAFGHIIGYLVEIPPVYAIFLAGIITTIYSTFGGIRSVTITDFFQLLTFGCIIPLLGIIIWNYAQDVGFDMKQALQEPKFNITKTLNFDNPNIWSIIFLFFYFTIPHAKPAWFQRISMGSNITQVKKAFAISLIVKFILISSILWIPFLVWNINPHIEQNELLSYIIENYITTGLKGLTIIAVTAMCMSTADSYINSSSVLFANDICRLLKVKTTNLLKVAKIYAFILGVGSIVLSISTNDLLGIHILANSFYMPVATPIILLSILGYRYPIKCILIGMLIGLLSSVTWKILGFNKAAGVLIPTTLNFLFLILYNYLFKHKTQRSNLSFLQNNRFQNISFKKLYKIFDIKNHIILPKSELSYIGLGVYIVIYTISTMYATPINLLKEENSIILIIYEIMIVSGMLITMYHLWPKTIINKTIMEVSWPIIIFIELIVFSGFFVMISNFGNLQFVIFTINMILSLILLGWKVCIPMIIAGFYLSIQIFKYYNNIDHIDFSIGSPQFILIYTLLILGSVTAIFFKPKQEEEKRKETKIKYLEKEVDYTQKELDNIKQGMEFLENQLKQKEGSLKKKELYLRDQVKIRNAEISKLTDMKDEFLRNITHESNTPMTGIISMCDVLYSCYDQLDNNQIKHTIRDIVSSGDRLKTYVNSIVDLSKLTSNRYELTKEDVNLGELAKERTILYKKIFSDETNKQKFIFNIEDDFIVNCDRYYITQTIDNLISNAVNYGRGKTITISIKRTKDNRTSFSISDQGIGIPKTELLSIFEKFSVGSKTKTPAGGRGVGLALCKSVIEAHDGSINAMSDENGTTLTFTLPI